MESNAIPTALVAKIQGKDPAVVQAMIPDKPIKRSWTAWGTVLLAVAGGVVAALVTPGTGAEKVLVGTGAGLGGVLTGLGLRRALGRIITGLSVAIRLASVLRDELAKNNSAEKG